jgi:hypothetical protein
MTVISGSMSVAGSLAKHRGEQRAADQAVAYQQQLTGAARAVASDQESAVRLRQAQERESIARDSETARIANAEARATARVSAGEAGIVGSSVDALMHEFSMQEGRYVEANLRQTEFADMSSSAEIDSIRQGLNYQTLRINTPVHRPSRLATGLSIGGAVLGAASTIYKMPHFVAKRQQRAAAKAAEEANKPKT